MELKEKWRYASEREKGGKMFEREREAGEGKGREVKRKGGRRERQA